MKTIVLAGVITVDTDEIKKKIKQTDTTIKTIKAIEKATVIGLHTADILTNGKVAEKLDKMQEKFDTKIGNQLENKVVQIENTLQTKVGQKIEDTIDKVQKAIDQKGGDLIDKSVQKAAESIQNLQDKVKIQPKLEAVKEKIVEGIDQTKAKIEEFKEKKKKSSTKSTPEPNT